MKRVLLAMFTLGVGLLLAGCPSAFDPTGSIGTNPVFRAQNIATGGWYDVPATLVAVGDHVEVFVENGQEVSSSTVQAIADEFDRAIYVPVRDTFGFESDVDGNGRVTILLLDIVDGYAPGGGYVAGYYDPTHVFSTRTYANSNEADMLFLDVDPGLPGSQAFYSTLAHEFQHLVNFANTYLVDGRQQQIWINEGLSSGAEYLYAGSIDSGRVSYFNADPGGSIASGNTFFVWNGYWEVSGDVLANYSSVYLFFQYLRIHAANGTGIYREILQSSHRDHQAVTSAAASWIDAGLADWDQLLASWMRANILGAGSGLDGYRGLIAVSQPRLPSAATDTIYLSSGEAVAAPTGGGSFDDAGTSGTHVAYLGIDTAGGTVDDVGTTYSGDVLLAFNTNTDPFAADQDAVVPNPDVVSPQMSSVGSFAGPTDYAIDVSLAPGGGLSPGSNRPGTAGRFPVWQGRPLRGAAR